MGAVTTAILATAATAAAAHGAYQQRKDAKEQASDAKKQASDIKKANEKAIAEAKGLQQKSEDQARARIAAASAEQERSKSIFSTLGGGLSGSSIVKKLLGQ